LFPQLYHAQHAGYVEDLDFWQELVSYDNKPILELGCGTGRVTLRLAEHGSLVFGLDNDFEMLTFLKNNITEELKPFVRCIQADMTLFRLALLFRYILLPCNTYSTFLATQRLSILATLRRHLLPGGFFVVSLPNPIRLASLQSQGYTEIEDVFPHPIDHEPVQVSNTWQRANDIFTLYWHYDHLLPTGEVKRHSFQNIHYLTSIEQYLNEFRGAGFDIIDLYGDFNYSRYEPDSPHLIAKVRWPN
jgi:SAM-dependent methyltransferase